MLKSFAMSAELDDLIALKVMRWERRPDGWHTGHHGMRAPGSFQPSSNLHHAAEMLRYMEAHWPPSSLERFHQALRQLTTDDGPPADLRLSADGLEQMPEFACRAALVAQLLYRL
ncbi:hypothetical protein D3C72_855980 [compost metagenome]